MAIDNAEKRKSAAGIPFLPLGVGVTPNASKDQEWRQQAGWGYSGILAGLLNVVSGPYYYAALGTHTPGAVATGTHRPGQIIGGTHQPGMTAGGIR